jgi:hypothetical protein
MTMDDLDTVAHVVPDPRPGTQPPPLRRAEDRAAYRPIESQARLSAIGAAYDHVEDTRESRVTFALVTRICNVYHEHLRMHGGSL